MVITKGGGAMRKFLFNFQLGDIFRAVAEVIHALGDIVFRIGVLYLVGVVIRTLKSASEKVEFLKWVMLLVFEKKEKGSME
jgi:hypothetical protein